MWICKEICSCQDTSWTSRAAKDWASPSARWKKSQLHSDWNQLNKNTSDTSTGATSFPSSIRFQIPLQKDYTITHDYQCPKVVLPSSWIGFFWPKFSAQLRLASSQVSGKLRVPVGPTSPGRLFWVELILRIELIFHIILRLHDGFRKRGDCTCKIQQKMKLYPTNIGFSPRRILVFFAQKM